MKTCATCKHCIWMPKHTRNDVIQTMSCGVYSEENLVVCDPPHDEACLKYEEVKNESQD